MKLYLIRHGITQSNIDKVYNGVVDEELTDVGKEDLINKKDKYNNIKFDYIYSSPLKRCLQSFAILFPEQAIDQIRDDLIEMDFGDWYGLKYKDKFKELFEQGYTFNDLVDPTNGETYKELFKRTTKFIDEIISKHENGNILVMAHGLVIAAIMYNCFPFGKNMYELSPGNGLGYIVEINEDNYIVEII